MGDCSPPGRACFPWRDPWEAEPSNKEGSLPLALGECPAERKEAWAHLGQVCAAEMPFDHPDRACFLKTQ